jgi:hypothetical protein
VITLAPGTSRPFNTADWADALVVLECGEVELEALSGCRVRLQPGAIFWLAGLPLRWLHNPGRDAAVLIAVSRVHPVE